MEAAEELRKMEKHVTLCFVTSHINYAYNAYLIDADGYVHKPIQYLDVKRLMEKAEMQLCYRISVEPVSYTHLDVYKRQGSGSHRPGLLRHIPRFLFESSPVSLYILSPVPHMC